MYKKIIPNVFDIGNHRITTEFFTIDNPTEKEKKIISNAIAGGIIEVVEEVKEETKAIKKGK